MKKRVVFILQGPHHLYIGAMLMFLGWTMQPWMLYDGFDTLFLVGGALIVLDDLIEHTITGSTPLRLFFEKVMTPILWRLRK